MYVYRLSGERYKNDLSGFGAAKQHGNRWNSYGTQMLYTSESPALCAVELHKVYPPNIFIKNFYLLEIQIPNTEPLLVSDEFFDKEGLWQRNINLTQQIGDFFIEDNQDLILKVPSVWIHNCFNYLINPHHKDFKKVKIIKTYPFPFSGKLFESET